MLEDNHEYVKKISQRRTADKAMQAKKKKAIVTGDSNTEEKEKEKEKEEEGEGVKELEEWRKDLNTKTADKLFKRVAGTRNLKAYLTEKGHKYAPLKENMLVITKELLREEEMDEATEEDE